jgi:hypothetical protein
MRHSTPDIKALLSTPVTTGIGSLPHHNIDAALAFSFRSGIPYLPQIPIRNPWEYMIPQALEGMPGLDVGAEGEALLNLDVWIGRSHSFNERLLEAFAQAARPDAFAAFEPSAAASSSWQPFLWELEERGHRIAKFQIAGPLTAQWVLRLKDGGLTGAHPEIAVQIYRLVLARAFAMCRRLQAGGIQPILFLDEPGLYGFSATNPRHVMGLQELKLMIQALRKENVLVGLHCCSNTDWNAILQLGLDIISIDVELSLDKVLAEPGSQKFLADGGRFSLGVIPTSWEAGESHVLEPAQLFGRLLEFFAQRWSGQPHLVKHVLSSALYTPACGLALHSPNDAESVAAALGELVKMAPVAEIQT